MPRWKLSLIGLAIVIGGAGLAYFFTRPSRDSLVLRVRHAMAERKLDRAERIVQTALQRFGSDPDVLLVAGEVAARDNRPQESLERYEQVVSTDFKRQARAAYGRGEACVRLAMYARAEREFLLAIKLDPQTPLALRRLVDVLIFTGRRYRAASWLEQVIRSEDGTLEDLFHLGDLDHLVSRPESVWADAEKPEADPYLVMGAGFQALADGRNHAAELYFERVLRSWPTDLDAQAGWGQGLLETNPERLNEWRTQLPSNAFNDAEILAILGRFAQQQNQHQLAVQRFSQVVAMRPTSRIAWHRLGIELRHVGQTFNAELALRQAEELQVLATRLNDLFGQRQNLNLVRRVTEQLAGMRRFTEAAAWARHATTISPELGWAKNLLVQMEQNPATVVDLQRETAITDLLQTLASQEIDVGISENDLTKQSAEGARSGVRNRSRIRFVDVAPNTGLDFVFFAARDASTPGARIIETTGGGVGVIDFDGDGWPDLYLTQGSREFPPSEPNKEVDRLFRNCLGQTWSDVSDSARLGDVQFGQGVAVGDFNHDGFADLYVANYGFNVLYQNQGDGTFIDVTPTQFRQRKVWTSSCVIADLNNDGWPDLFDATYCRGADVETRICRMQDVVRSCSPRVFGAEDDRLWLNDGASGWASCPSGLDRSDGLGLGVVAFRPDTNASLGLFIANDETSNFWLVNTETRAGERPTWEDRASIAGLAVDGDGQAQACMGIACDDANGDGLPDLFVSNFYQESNTLYSSVAPDLFEDRTRVAQLRHPSWNQLGFGTQFLDADLDGWPDLLVANGHVDDLSALGIPFRMPLQCFQNQAGTFQELTADQAGACFARPALGRGMCRFDWNRDGREDVVVVNQESPAVLLQNASEDVGNSITLQFRGVESARDAIGTIVRLQIGSRILTRQITAGDGFQASNERQLVIGTGSAALVDRIEIDWPDHSKQRFTGLATGRRYLVIQNRPKVISL